MNMQKLKRFERFLDSGLFEDLFRVTERTHTRKINPKLGILGVFGFLGFTGFIPPALHITSGFTVPSFFFFFAFFGFFGFYYEGKMSDTFMDERFIANRHRATAIADKLSFAIVFLTAIMSISILRLDTYHTLGILIAGIGFAFGLSAFLQQYLLFGFENEE